MSVAALLLAAGRGERLGLPVPKAFAMLAGRPLLLHALDALLAAPELRCIVPVLPAADFDRFRAALGPRAGEGRLTEPVAGGERRQDSVRAGLDALPGGIDWVAVHDAARPLVRAAAVRRVVAAARRSGAAILAAPVRDTVKRVEGNRIAETPPRTSLWAAQTPQVFRVELLREALAKAGAEGFVATDDAELVERLGVPVEVVEGDPDNWKLTHPEDLELAEALLRRRAAERP